MEKYVITIARQYGSGGRTIGEMLADRLGIHFYDKELMKLASEDSGINERLFNTADEKVKQSVFSKMFKTEKAYTGEVISPESGGFISDDNLFNSFMIDARIQIKEIDANEAFLTFSFVHAINSSFDANPSLGNLFEVDSNDFV